MKLSQLCRHLVLVLSVAAYVVAYPLGAPEEICQDAVMKPQHIGTFFQTSPAPYSISIDTSDGTAFTNSVVRVRIVGNSQNDLFRGFALQARRDEYQYLTNDPFRAEFTTQRDQVKNISCGVTHTNRDDKRSISLLFTTPSTPQTLEFIATVVQRYQTYWSIRAVLNVQSSSSGLDCPRGQYYDRTSTRCRNCGPGYYQGQTGQESCVLCQQGLSTVTATAISSGECYDICAPGRYTNTVDDPVTCTPCPEGFYSERGQNSDGSLRTQCQRCPTDRPNTGGSGSTREADCSGNQFNNCPPGSYIGPADGCFRCAKGTFNPSWNQGSCIPCDDGRTTTGDGADRESLCLVTDDPCPRGYYKSGLECFACPKGYYQDQPGTRTCIQCRGGQTTRNSGSTSINDCLSDGCARGEYITNGNCVRCAPGFYQDELDQSACKACSEGSYQSDSGAVSCDSCGSGFTSPRASTRASDCSSTACPSGSYRTTGGCVSCPRGTYQDRAGQSGCLDCPVATYQPNTGARECRPCGPERTTTGTGSWRETDCLFIDCAPGTHTIPGGCEDCPSGSFQDGLAQATCIPCFKGSYQPSAGQTECLSCGPDRTTTGTGARFGSECFREACRAGQRTIPGGCEDCPRGTFQDSVGAGSCIDCPKGRYQALIGMTECTACPGARTTAGSGSTSVSECFTAVCSAGSYTIPGGCLDCPRGQYQPDAGQSQCVACPKGSYQPATGAPDCFGCGPGRTTSTTGRWAESDCITERCSAGSYRTNSGCIACPRGYYQDQEEQAGCLECAKGYYQDVTGGRLCKWCGEDMTTEGIGAESFSQCQREVVDRCDEGEEWNAVNRVCVSCPIGYYKEKGDASCIKCTLGITTAHTGSVSRYQCCHFIGTCPDGYERNYDDYTCDVCARDSYKGPSDTNCQTCPRGTHYTGTGATSVNDCVTDRPICEEGSYYTGARCDLCPAGQYQDFRNQESCKDCPDGYTSDRGATRRTECFIDQVVCPEGEYATSRTRCTLCEIGTYNPLTGQDRCVDCEPGLTTNTRGATRRQQCIPADCGQGKYRSGNQCYDCPRGYYQPATDSNTCLYCGDDSYTENAGSTSAADCIPRTPTCQAGYYLSGGICVACPRGSFMPTPGSQTSCFECPDGESTANIASTSVNECFRAIVCRAGEFNNGQTCENCPRGSYQPDTNRNGCIDCPGDSTTTTVGATSASQCVPDNNCQRGSYWTSLTCELCPRNYYQPNNRATTCLPCPDNRVTTSTGAVSVNECLGGNNCRAGTSWTGTFCEQCNFGFYQDRDFQTSCVRCQNSGTTNRRGATSASECSGGPSNNCGIGTYWTGSNCQVCEFGTYQNQQFQTSCISCTSGTTSRRGATSASECTGGNNCASGQFFNGQQCQLCLIGYYQPSSGQSSCLRCPNFGLTAITGATSMSQCYGGGGNNCNPGSYWNSQSCVQCQPGQYQPNSQQLSCLTCPTGTTSGSGATTCNGGGGNQCQAGYQWTGGLCQPCPLGTYKSNSGSQQCIVCPSGQLTSQRASTSQTQCTQNCNSVACVQDPCAGQTCAGVPGAQCVSNYCGGCNFFFVFKGEVLSNQECSSNIGVCQRPVGIGICQSACNPNVGGCPFNQLCCSNGCGRTCQTPVQPVCNAVSCTVDPCFGRSCNNFPGATCVPNICEGTCTSNFFFNGLKLSNQLCSGTVTNNCNPGSYWNSQSCVQCQPGQYQPNSQQLSCLTCPTGTTSGSGATTCTGGGNQCQAGYQWNGGLCQPCPLGTYKSNSGPQQCIVCPAGQITSQRASVSQTQCTQNCNTVACAQDPCAGQTCAGVPGAQCVPNYCGGCNFFFVFKGEVLSNQECSSNIGVCQRPTGIGSCQGSCNPNVGGCALNQLCCSNGCAHTCQNPVPAVCNGVSCTVDPCFGRSCNNFPGASCVPNICEGTCTSNFFFNGLKLSDQLCSGTVTSNCNAGSFWNGASCQACAPGRYQPAAGQNTCLTCPQGSTSTQAGATNCVTINPQSCNAGSSWINGICQLCQQGSYKSVAGTQGCTQCPQGRTTNAPGATNVQMCIITQSCNPGSYWFNGGCQLCQQGSYKPAAGSQGCTQCPQGRTTNGPGATNVQMCLVQGGQNCNQGSYWTGAVCTGCQIGFYKSVAGPQLCTSCQAGQTTAQTASTSPTQCYTPTTNVCNPGTYWNGQVCLQCGIGKYQAQSGQTSCDLCVSTLTTTFTGATNAAQCTPNNPPCSVGTYEYQGICRICPAGFYQATPGSTTCSQCQAGTATAQARATSGAECTSQIP